MGGSYIKAIAVTMPGGQTDHTFTFDGQSCVTNGEPCGTDNGKNVGVDGIKVVPYVPSKGYQQYGDFGTGVKGWFLYAGVFKVNVTVTMTADNLPMMNAMVRAPPMCTVGATGLCTAYVSTADEKLMSFAASYYQRMHSDKAPRSRKNLQKLQNTQMQEQTLRADSDATEPHDEETALIATGDAPVLAAYPALSNPVASLKSMACPA